MLQDLWTIAIHDPEWGWIWHKDDQDSRYSKPAVFVSLEDAEVRASEFSRKDADNRYAAVNIRTRQKTVYQNGDILAGHWILEYYQEEWTPLPEVEFHNFHDANSMARLWNQDTGLAVRLLPCGLDESPILYDFPLEF